MNDNRILLKYFLLEFITTGVLIPAANLIKVYKDSIFTNPSTKITN
jgi:hypothetical protein